MLRRDPIDQAPPVMNADATTDAPPLAAAIHHDGSSDVDEMLHAFTQRQRAAGRRVLGLLMAPRKRELECQAAMVLVDVDNGDEYVVSQPLGGDSTACRADPQAFAHASRVLRAAAVSDADLVVCDRVGGMEAENRGFCAELLALMERGIPVLTAVAPLHIDAWREFSGGAPVLPPRIDAWAAWLNAALQQRA
jgi:nucleoside-triphosphatase THEP1